MALRGHRTGKDPLRRWRVPRQVGLSTGIPFQAAYIYMITPSGRFKVNTRLCLSISDFHPDTWNPAWSVASILTGLVSFMTEKTPTLGSLETSDYTKRQLALQSLECNLQNKVFVELFPDLCDDIREKLKDLQTGVATAS